MRDFIARAILWFIGPVINKWRQEDLLHDEQQRIALAEDWHQQLLAWQQASCQNLATATRLWKDQLAALQALDVTFNETGHIVILARVNNRDIVKIIRIPPKMSMAEFKRLSDMLERTYGVGTRRVDLPSGVPLQAFLAEAGAT